MASIIGDKGKYRTAEKQNDGYLNATTGDLTPPIGYVLVAMENGIRSFSTPTNLAFGANNSFKFLTNKSGNVKFDIATFGGDPARNYVKGGFAEVSIANATEVTQAAATTNSQDAQHSADEAIAMAQAAVAKAQADAAKAAKTKKIIIYSAIGVGVLIAGIIVFRMIKKRKK
jgi:hypothetical protein